MYYRFFVTHLSVKKILVRTFLLGCFFSVNAQSQFSGWLASFNTFKTGAKTSIHNDIQWRSTDEWQHTQTFLFRAGLNVHLNKLITVTSGYAFIHNRRVVNSVAGYAPEHRVWEQVLINHKLSRVAISHRFRLEQRFIAASSIVNNQLENEGHAYAGRLRYFIRNLLPLKKEESFQRGFFVALQNEVFVNISHQENVNGKFFDQNRLYLAIGYRLSAKVDLETGYLNQYTQARSGHTNNHVAQVAGYFRL